MIGAVFQLFNEIIEVRIDGNSCLFRTGQYGGAFVPIEGLKLDKNGVIKEHPDLKDSDDWREESIKRFKEYLKNIEGETMKMEYIIKELTKSGYKPMSMQRNGHRPIKIK